MGVGGWRAEGMEGKGEGGKEEEVGGRRGRGGEGGDRGGG